MTSQRRIALALVVLEALAYAFFGKAVAFPVLISIAACLGAPGRLTFKLNRAIHLVLALALTILILISRQSTPESPRILHIMFGGMGISVAQFFLCMQVLELFIERKRGLPSRFALFGVLALMAVGDVLNTHLNGILYQGTSVVFVGLCCAFFATGRPEGQKPATPGYRLASAGVLGAVMTLGVAWSAVAMPYLSRLDALLMNVMSQMREDTRIGFEVNSTLGTVAHTMSTNENATALRIRSERMPGYLRGRAYTSFLMDNWFVSVPYERFRAGARPPILPEPEPGEETFRVREAPSRGPAVPQPEKALVGSMEVVPSEVLGRVLFAPLETVWIGGSHEVLRINSYGIVESEGEGIETLERYFVYTMDRAGASVVPLSQAELRACLQYPDSLDPEVKALAGRLFEGRDTTREKVASLLDYFRENHTYRMGIEIPEGADPVSHFLLERPGAHCEYFATGAALLLRLGGVPCRYVAGFMATEQNLVGEYWIARNKDAHAWLEVFDEKTGWFTVDPTPPIGRPRAENVAQLAYLWDHVGLHLKKLGQARPLTSATDLTRSLFDVLSWTLVKLFTTAAGLVALGLAAGLATTAWAWRRRPAPPLFSVQQPSLAALLRRVDKRLGKRGIVRRPAETLHQFAERIRTAGCGSVGGALARDRTLGAGEFSAKASAWYEQYAGIRYGGNVTESDIDSLRRSIPVP